MNISITKNPNPAPLTPEEKLGFGRVFSDHMFMMDWEAGRGWYDARIVPFGRIDLHPASTVLHYGAEIFEGLKAYRRADGGIPPGRNLAVILEVAAMNNRQRKMGYNPALEFTEQINRHFDENMGQPV